MCQNKEVSIIIFIFSISLMIKLLVEYNNTNEIKYLYAAFYILILGLMQLTEFFIHLTDVKSLVYQFSSICIFIVILIQFIMSEICIYKYGNMPTACCIIDIVFYLCVASFIPVLINNFGSYDNKFDCSRWFGCKLSWDPFTKIKNNNMYPYYLFWIIYLIYILYSTYLIFDITGLLLLIFTFFITLVPPHTKRPFGGGGSAWCLYTVVLVVILLIVHDNVLEKSHIT